MSFNCFTKSRLCKGLDVLDFPLAPTPTACVNNLLSANVKKYPPGSFKFDKPEKFKVVGLTVVVAPNDNCTAYMLAVTICNLDVPLGNVTNL